jgi:hypothetical protein
MMYQEIRVFIMRIVWNCAVKVENFSVALGGTSGL